MKNSRNDTVIESNLSDLDKKDLKNLVNKHGFFNLGELTFEKNEAHIPEEFKNKVPEGAIYFEGIASTGELNRNGYIIRPSAFENAMSVWLENPVILLQHRMDKPIGNGLSGSVVDQEVRVTGFVFDDLTGGLVGRDLLKMLSTGHITLDFEWENTETGEVISRDDFKALREEKGFFGEWEKEWVVAVTELDFVEFSFVTIPSNKSAKVTKKEQNELLKQVDIHFEKVRKEGLTMTSELLKEIHEEKMTFKPNAQEELKQELKIKEEKAQAEKDGIIWNKKEEKENEKHNKTSKKTSEEEVKEENSSENEEKVSENETASKTEKEEVSESATLSAQQKKLIGVLAEKAKAKIIAYRNAENANAEKKEMLEELTSENKQLKALSQALVNINPAIGKLFVTMTEELELRARVIAAMNTKLDSVIVRKGVSILASQHGLVSGDAKKKEKVKTSSFEAMLNQAGVAEFK